ncbi:hypothetical protein GYMLUDRAFT_880538 [Collybiopsis luxurians FD-317 M1]|uniref:Uncharacterized protein n=1 Tax=Collybiopsis luxurians FD-317 M1 TaxID=944289 RepID=A0A0D0BYW6_9AGAR|nr:hypothetical protein GYMLUDRAFT_880538 [Collybiopsis luxurians FD-317 M1]
MIEITVDDNNPDNNITGAIPASSGPSGPSCYINDIGLHGNGSKTGSSHREKHKNRAAPQTVAKSHVPEFLAPVVPYSDNERPRTRSKTKQVALTANNNIPDDIAFSPAKKDKSAEGEQSATSQKKYSWISRFSEVIWKSCFIQLNDESEGLETQRMWWDEGLGQWNGPGGLKYFNLT